MLIERVARCRDDDLILRASARREDSIYPRRRRSRSRDDHLFCFSSRETNLCLVVIGSINIHA